jgi:hypothetical protein
MDKSVTIRPAFPQPGWIGLAALFVASIVGPHFLARIEITADHPPFR